ncbi:hypothetical protein [Membranihabitans marinus]|nr:hypothetical protein [Membranihabitans marinus]
MREPEPLRSGVIAPKIESKSTSGVIAPKIESKSTSGVIAP